VSPDFGFFKFQKEFHPMTICGFLRRFGVLALAMLALAGAGASQPASDSTGCAERALGRPFLPWLDLAYYTVAPNGGLEAGVDQVAAAQRRECRARQRDVPRSRPGAWDSHRNPRRDTIRRLSGLDAIEMTL
jgi:hypothetical protein